MRCWHKLISLSGVKVVDESVGANRNAIAKASSRVQSVPPGKRRFQAGGVDEISFLGEDFRSSAVDPNSTSGFPPQLMSCKGLDVSVTDSQRTRAR